MISTVTLRKTTMVVTLCKALADDTRIRIVRLLRDGELCVCDLNDGLDVSQPLLSHHLKVLKDAGLIADRRSGRWVYYSLDRETIEQLQAFLNDARTPRKRSRSSARCCD